MRGDLNKLIEQVNLVTEKLADRIVALEDKVQLLQEGSQGAKPAPKRVSEKKEAETEAA
jgi:hypothetical protein